MTKSDHFWGGYEIKTQFRLVIGLEPEMVVLRSLWRTHIFMPSEGDGDVFTFKIQVDSFCPPVHKNVRCWLKTTVVNMSDVVKNISWTLASYYNIGCCAHCLPSVASYYNIGCCAHCLPSVAPYYKIGCCDPCLPRVLCPLPPKCGIILQYWVLCPMPPKCGIILQYWVLWPLPPKCGIILQYWVLWPLPPKGVVPTASQVWNHIPSVIIKTNHLQLQPWPKPGCWSREKGWAGHEGLLSFTPW